MAKSKPIGVRFDLEKLELIQKEQNLASPQAVVNYFLDGYKSISNQKTLLEIIDTHGVPNIIGRRAAGTSNLAFKPENGTITAENQKTPPKGLKGIDLMIWKSENGI